MVLDLSASLPALYGGLPFDAACEAAAADGFGCAEIWETPDPRSWDDATAALSRNNLRLTSVNTPAGGGASFGTAANPDTATTWRSEFVMTLEFARQAGANAVNVLPGGRLAGLTVAMQLSCLRANLEWALSRLGADDPVLLLEPLNAADRASPLLHQVAGALENIEALGSDRVKLLFDAYHLYQEEPDLLEAFRRARPYVGHVQLADFPGRGEPGSGRLPWRSFLAEVVSSGYVGRIGCEFVPTNPKQIALARDALTAALAAETAAAS